MIAHRRHAWPSPQRLLAAAVALVAVVAAAVASVTVAIGDERGRVEPSAGGTAATPEQRQAVDAGERFLDRYVDPDGRVVRRDQGGDTVSEGQAYAMLLAAALGDRARFDAVWSWTARHLRRPDGLLSWRWADGRVVAAEAAADADVDAAHALVLAERRFDDERYGEAADELAAAVLAGETSDHEGRPVLVAGPWARQEPRTVNPSYLSPVAFSLLAARASDERWAALAASGRDLVDQLTAGSAHLPPDWAVLGDGGVRPAPAPRSAGDPRFGMDAARVMVRFAVSCDAADRELAARAWPFFRRVTGHSWVVAAYRLDGSPATHRRHAIQLVAAAAAASAAGERTLVGDLLDDATRLHERGPSYYGAAWMALGRVLLTHDPLGGCTS